MQLSKQSLKNCFDHVLVTNSIKRLNCIRCTSAGGRMGSHRSYQAKSLWWRKAEEKHLQTRKALLQVKREAICVPLRKQLQRNVVLGHVSPLSSELGRMGFVLLPAEGSCPPVRASFFSSCLNVSQDEATGSGHSCGQSDLLWTDTSWSSAQPFRSLNKNVLVGRF